MGEVCPFAPLRPSRTWPERGFRIPWTKSRLRTPRTVPSGREEAKLASNPSAIRGIPVGTNAPVLRRRRGVYLTHGLARSALRRTSGRCDGKERPVVGQGTCRPRLDVRTARQPLGESLAHHLCAHASFDDRCQRRLPRELSLTQGVARPVGRDAAAHSASLRTTGSGAAHPRLQGEYRRTLLASRRPSPRRTADQYLPRLEPLRLEAPRLQYV